MTASPGPAAGPTPEALAERVKATGRRLGFDLVGIASAAPPDHGAAFAAWVAEGYAGTMTYLTREPGRRLDPERVLPGARSVVACALGYHQGRDAAGPGHVARYAWGEDYHGVMEPRLRALLADLDAAAPGTRGRAYVDTGPVLERDLAARAGVGWIGKNTMLLDQRLGSYFVLGVILTTAALAPDAPVADRCGTCTRCLDACPTGAFVRPHVLDARRCISYLTIERRGAIPPELRVSIGAWAFGCDVCQDVCPWNRKAPVTGEAAFAARDLPALAELLSLDEPGYRARLAGSPLRRARRDGLARNAAVALGNAGDPAAVSALVTALEHAAPQVRAHAAWALGRIDAPDGRRALARARLVERDAEVVAEIDAALGATGTGPAGDAPGAGRRPGWPC